MNELGLVRTRLVDSQERIHSLLYEIYPVVNFTAYGIRTACELGGISCHSRRRVYLRYLVYYIANPISHICNGRALLKSAFRFLGVDHTSATANPCHENFEIPFLRRIRNIFIKFVCAEKRTFGKRGGGCSDTCRFANCRSDSNAADFMTVYGSERLCHTESDVVRLRVRNAHVYPAPFRQVADRTFLKT